MLEWDWELQVKGPSLLEFSVLFFSFLLCGTSFATNFRKLILNWAFYKHQYANYHKTRPLDFFAQACWTQGEIKMHLLARDFSLFGFCVFYHFLIQSCIDFMYRLKHLFVISCSNTFSCLLKICNSQKCWLKK